MDSSPKDLGCFEGVRIIATSVVSSGDGRYPPLRRLYHSPFRRYHSAERRRSTAIKEPKTRRRFAGPVGVGNCGLTRPDVWCGAPVFVSRASCGCSVVLVDDAAEPVAATDLADRG